VLGAILGAGPGVFFAGELYRCPHPIFERPDPDRRCSCGVAVDLCPFWVRIRERLEAEPGLSAALRAGQLRYERWRSIPRTLWKLSARDPGLLAHIARMGRFLRILSEESGASVLVESSYNPLRGRLYQDRSSEVNVRFLHLVRDGRNFLVAERTAVDPPEVAWRWLRSTPVILARWVFAHLLSLVLLGRGRRYLRIRFETMVRSPQPILGRVARLAEVDLDAVVDRVTAGDLIPMRHIAAGNRLRLLGTLRLRTEYASPPHLSLLGRAAFWGLAGWLALILGYRPGGAAPPVDGAVKPSG
ncbi:MAG: hypothetical protein ACREC5_03310, partial [Thermoplasmata archaeon]